MMSGPRLAKNYVSNYLSNDLADRLVTYRNHWGLSATQLPAPAKYLSYEPFALDHWPTVISLVLNTRSVTRDGYESDADPNYRVTYEMRTYVWVRANGAETVTEQRDNLTTVVREALMDGPSLSSYDAAVPCYAKIDEGTIREEFSDLTLIKGERLLAGAYIAYDLSLNEVIDVSHLGIMQDGQPTVSKMPITPNAPTDVIAVGGNAQVTLTWGESTWNGGVHPLTSYAVQQSTDGGTTWVSLTTSTGSTDPLYVATGLNNGTSYKFRVAGINQAGLSDYSSLSVAVTPSAS
tara:strand:- start:20 stop:895 length:876 start_codon:yes stop_codon:yes gene_type:complete